MKHRQPSVWIDDKPTPTNIGGGDVGFPRKSGSSVSYWLQGVQGDPLLNHRTTPELPSSADIVVIGSGITGTLVAKSCLDTWPNKSVVVLEAREFCSGATGRNAGHCKPDQWRGFSDYQEACGTQQALKILENEHQTWSDLVGYIQANKVDCDLWVGDTFDVPVTLEVANTAKDNFERYKAAGGKVDHIKVTHNPTEAVKITHIKDAQACYAWPASTLYPWKLAAHVMRENLKKGVNLQTQNRVNRVFRCSDNPDKWVVNSERGDIECTQVVHATNAYSPALEPSLRGIIFPTPHMCNQVQPPLAFREANGLKNSYGVLLPNRGLITINPRCTTGGPMLFGGSNPGQQDFETWLQAHPERRNDDGLPGFKSVTRAVQTFAESQLPEWPTGSTNLSDIYSDSWSGIIGLSADGVPFVGELPGLPGQWICAGHHGHGMARIFTAAPGLVQLMNGGSWADTRLPEVFQITASRINSLRKRSSIGNTVFPRL
ncbi:Fc.00g079430.m01.CDS01 [Cosmosporella sp. VM-42]